MMSVTGNGPFESGVHGASTLHHPRFGRCYNRCTMGHLIELNDTLKLKRGDGFPAELRVGGVYDFSIAGRRLYNLKPTRVFLVEEIDGKWNVVGHAMILRQTIDAETERTSGQFEVSKLYPPEYVKLVNQFDAPAGKGFVPGV